MSEAEDMLALHLRESGIVAEREYRFAAIAAGGAGKGLRTRLASAGLKDWRFDFAMPAKKIAIECEADKVWNRGRLHYSVRGREAA